MTAAGDAQARVRDTRVRDRGSIHPFQAEDASPTSSGRSREERPDRLASGLALATAALAPLLAIHTALSLTTRSYQVDELFTRWVIDPAGLRYVFWRAVDDVHPPLYYLLVAGWGHLFGTSEVALRTLSWLGAVAALPILYVGLACYVGRTARLLALGLAASSVDWITQSQNARMYGIGLAAGAALVVSALAVAFPEGRDVRKRVAALLGTAFVASFLHYYLFLAAGATLAVTGCFARSRATRLTLIAGAAALLAAVAGFVAFQRGHALLDIHSTWFEASARWFADQSVRAVLDMLPCRPIRRSRWAGSPTRLAGLGIGLGVPVLVAVAGIAVSLLLAPSYSGRNMAVTAPFLWAATAILLDVALARLTPRWRSFLVAVTAACVATAAWADRDAALRTSEPWRSAEAFATADPACRGAAIPALIRYFGTPPGAAFADEIAFQYRYYLAPGSRVELVLNDGHRTTFPPAAAATIRARAAGADRCPTVLLAVHVGQVDPAEVACALERVANGRSIAATPFRDALGATTGIVYVIAPR